MDTKRRGFKVSKAAAGSCSKNMVHSPLRTEIAHPKDALRLREQVRKKHGLDRLYMRLDDTKESLDALHEHHKPIEVKVSEIFAKHSRVKHYDRLMNYKNTQTKRKNDLLTLVLGFLVILAAGIFYFNYPKDISPNLITGAAVSDISTDITLVAPNPAVIYIISFVLSVILLVALADFFLKRKAHF
jgi:hypothetical protein